MVNVHERGDTHVVPPLQGATEHLLFVDPQTPVPSDSQDGSRHRPFATIQQAIDVIPQAQSVEESRNVYCPVIAPADYDEDLNVDITGRRILLLSKGPWGLGTFENADWGPSGTRRNINISGLGNNFGGIRTGFGIANFPRIGQRYSTHQSYLTGARISGAIVFTATGGSIEVDIEAEVFGNGGRALDATATNPILQMYLYNGRWRADVLGGTNSQFQHASNVRFGGLVSVGAYSLMDRCRFSGGFTVGAAAPAGLQPQGFMNCVFTGGTFTGPAGSLRLDAFTDYWVRTNGVILAGGASKVYYGADALSVSYAAASAANWNGSPPANIRDALDRIAAAVGPIA